MLKWLESDSVLSKGKEDNLCLLLIWKLVGEVGNTQMYVPAHITKIPEIHNRNPTCPRLMKTAWKTWSCRMKWGLHSQYKVKIQLLSVVTKAKNPGCALWTYGKEHLHEGGEHFSVECDRETGNPGRKWKNNRSLADMKTEGKDQRGQLWRLNYLPLVEGYACWLLKRSWNMEYSPFFPRGFGGQELTSI